MTMTVDQAAINLGVALGLSSTGCGDLNCLSPAEKEERTRWRKNGQTTAISPQKFIMRLAA
jgi:hypothetical protein